MRCFLGLDLSPSDKLAVANWREKALPRHRAQVPVANFHVTSVFLGQISDPQLDQLCRQMDTLEHAPVDVHLDQLGYWSKPKVLYLGSSHPCEQAASLAIVLEGFATVAQIPIQRRPYIPHVTLVRKQTEPVPAPLFPADIACRFDTVHLFESVSGKHGVHYPIRQSWPLRPPIHPGKR